MHVLQCDQIQKKIQAQRVSQQALDEEEITKMPGFRQRS